MKRQERVERFEQVHERRRRGHSARRIARELGLSRRSVFRYLRRATCPAWGLGGSRRSSLDGYREWIDVRLAEDFTSVAALHRLLAEQGFRGSYGSVWEFVTKRLGAAGKRRERLNAVKPAVPSPPSARQLSFEWVRRPEDRKAPEQERIGAIRAGGTELAAGLHLADSAAAGSCSTGFQKVLRARSMAIEQPRCLGVTRSWSLTAGAAAASIGVAPP